MQTLGSGINRLVRNAGRGVRSGWREGLPQGSCIPFKAERSERTQRQPRHRFPERPGWLVRPQNGGRSWEDLECQPRALVVMPLLDADRVRPRRDWPSQPVIQRRSPNALPVDSDDECSQPGITDPCVVVDDEDLAQRVCHNSHHGAGGPQMAGDDRRPRSSNIRICRDDGRPAALRVCR